MVAHTWFAVGRLTTHFTFKQSVYFMSSKGILKLTKIMASNDY